MRPALQFFLLMKTCRNCRHDIKKIKGKWMHRMEHSKYSGIGGTGGVTFNKKCLNKIHLIVLCGCDIPEPYIK